MSDENDTRTFSPRPVDEERPDASRLDGVTSPSSVDAVSPPTADEAAFADWESWLEPSVRALVRTPTGRGELVDPLGVAAIFAHRSSPLYAELRPLPDSRLWPGPVHALGIVMRREDGARWIDGIPADQVACVVAIRDEVLAIGVDLASLFDRKELING